MRHIHPAENRQIRNSLMAPSDGSKTELHTENCETEDRLIHQPDQMNNMAISNEWHQVIMCPFVYLGFLFCIDLFSLFYLLCINSLKASNDTFPIERNMIYCRII